MSKERLKRFFDFPAWFDPAFDQLLTADAGVPAPLREAVRYSALAPGKRIRPYLVVRCAELAGAPGTLALPAAAAVECVHAFSLVHDDLPAMDDDDVRRGRPTCHKVFGDATAILAGDALVVFAFELLARHYPNAYGARMVGDLAEGAGWQGMIGGQAADMEGESQPSALERTESIHTRKTASLFRIACRLGAYVGGSRPDQLETFGRYGEWLGRAFQIADDLLDVTATADSVGKNVHKDGAAGKQTYPRCVGIERSRAAARDAAERAVAALGSFQTSGADLAELARFVACRDY